MRRIANPRGLLSVLLVAAAAVGVVVVVLAVRGAMDNSDADKRRQPIGTMPAPSTEVAADATDIERGMHFGLHGRVLTVQLLPPVGNETFAERNQIFETVSGARISATCGAPPGDPRREITLTARWPARQTGTFFRFPRAVSRWCRLEDQSGSILAS